MNAPQNISINRLYNIIVEEINGFLSRNEIIFQVVAFAVVVAALYYMFRSIYSHKARSIDSNIYTIYCLAILINALGAGLTATFGDKTPNIVPLIASFAFLCLPALLCLHIWSQVDYKRITPSIVLLYLAVPTIVILVKIYDVIKGVYTDNVWNTLCLSSISLLNLLFVIYWMAMVVKSLSLCFNVLYQMPKHMRGSTMMLISARILLAVATVIVALINSPSAYLIILIAFFIVMRILLGGFFKANASNVITTSRQFVFSNLSTMILVLSLKGRILEWNKPGEPGLFSFVRPKYLQPFTEYKKLLLEKCNGVVSPHDENVITLTINGKEMNLMLTTKPIKEGDRQFGTLIELSEITSIYSILRAMESIAELDYMTGLFNRNAYMGMANKFMTAENMPLLIIVGDVNNLKTINDTYSHLSGDRLLCCVSDIIKSQAPNDAFIARIGGDEIVLLVPGATEETAYSFSTRVHAATEKVSDDEFGQPSISFGWSVIHSENEDYNSAFEKADEMMYEYKRAYKAGKPLVLSGSLQKKSSEEAAVLEEGMLAEATPKETMQEEAAPKEAAPKEAATEDTAQ